MKVYFDNAATTPLAKEVMEAIIPVMENDFGNPSSTHSFGRQSKSHLELSRKKIADLMGCTTSEIIFTSGGTEADNMVLNCAVQDLGVKRIISSPIEHHAVHSTIERLHENGLIAVDWVNILPNGHVDTMHLEQLLAKNDVPTLVSLMHANNEIGNMIDLHQIGDLCKKYNALFHSDTVQTVAHFPFKLSDIPVDFIVASAHKFHGPKGVGFLYSRKELKLKKFIVGGSQERNKRGGTENLYGIVGMAKALEIANHNMEMHIKEVEALKKYMIAQLRTFSNDIQFNGDAEGKSNYIVLNVSFPPTQRAPMFLFELDMKGVAASGGSACSSGSEQGSHVLNELKVEKNRPNVRFSFSRYNTKEEIDFCIAQIKSFYLQEKKIAIH